MLSFFLTLLTTIIFSFLPERWIKPKAPRPTLTTIILQASLVTIVFLVLTLIVQRAVFSGIAIFIFLIILVAVNNAKYKALNEPMVFSDFAMFSQAFKHPRLYFPFLGLLPVIIAPVIIIGLIITVLKLEPALAFTWKRILASILTIITLLFISKKIALNLPLSSNPEEDNAQFGLQNSLYAYSVYAFTDEHQRKIKKALKSSPFIQDKTQIPPPLFPHVFLESKPNITVIQSESFFDARHLHPSIKKDVLKYFDKVCAESVQYGQLKVPAWGANTMRTEYAFLSGIENQKMGLFRYYPYQFLSKLPVSSIASALKAQGYYCVCVHPHSASFFGRDKLFPALGFDEFIDDESFYTTSNTVNAQNAEKFGPYISDQSITNKIIEITKEKTSKPLFIFAITMENHGPLHLEKTTAKEQETYYSDKTLNNTNDLTVYLRHLKNADKMLKQLTTAFTKSDKAHTLCFYGDHIPSMPDIYTLTDYKDHDSDYIIWTNNKPKKTQQSAMAVENLAETLLKLKVHQNQ